MDVVCDVAEIVVRAGKADARPKIESAYERLAACA